LIFPNEIYRRLDESSQRINSLLNLKEEMMNLQQNTFVIVKEADNPQEQNYQHNIALRFDLPLSTKLDSPSTSEDVLSD